MSIHERDGNGSNSHSITGRNAEKAYIKNKSVKQFCNDYVTNATKQIYS